MAMATSPTPLPEAWLRGPLPGIPALLQPAAHAFVMAREDVDAAVADISSDELWAQPGGVASLGFHLAHLAGSTGRLLAYARGESLTDAQKAALLRERTIATLRPSKEQLLAEWHAAVETALAQIGATPEAALTDARAIGRAQLPTTVGGAVFHAAEHAARHAGQIITTAMVIRASR